MIDIEPKKLTLEEIKEAWYFSDKVKFNNVDEETKTEYHLSLIDEDTLLISFQRTRQKKDWVYNFCFWKKPYSNMKETFFVHWGFLKKYKAVQDRIHKAIGEYAPKKILLRGYSQGGAIAQIAHEDISWNYPNIDVQTIVFGSPQPFSLFNHKDVKERLKNVLRVEYEGDIVTYIPSIIFGYWSYGTKVRIGPKKIFGTPKGHTEYNELLR